MAVNFQVITRHRSLLHSMRGTSGDLGHPRQSRYRCSLPGLAGFAGPRCTEPEVPRSGSRSSRLLQKILTQRHRGNQRAQPTTALRCSEFPSGIRSATIFSMRCLLLRFCWLFRRRIRRHYISRIYPIHFKRTGGVHLDDRIGLAQSEVAHLFRHADEVARIHRF
jgi:hypothetical protein